MTGLNDKNPAEAGFLLWKFCGYSNKRYKCLIPVIHLAGFVQYMTEHS